jgi:sugar/nucleoside kinase (ribokinase family)
MDVVGSGALNLDLLYEVADLAAVRAAGFALSPGREISGDHQTAGGLIRFLDENGRFMARSGGGSSANTICALARLGWETGFLGAIGEDRAGDYILDSMEGVDCSLVKRGGRSAVCVVVTERGNPDRAMLVAPQEGGPDPHDPEGGGDIADAKVLHLSSLVHDEGLRAQVRLVASLGPWQILSFDPGEIYAAKGIVALSGILVRTDILFVTEQEVSILTGRSGERGLETLHASLNLLRRERRDVRGTRLFSEAGGPVVFCKQGTRGAVVYSRGLRCHVPAEEVVRVVDNTGAGDAFNAGCLNAVFREGSAFECLRAGVGLAARSLSAFGRGWMDTMRPRDSKQG